MVFPGRIACVWLALAAMLRAASADEPVKDAPLPEPFLVRQTVFSLPFRLEPPRKISEQPVEVQLRASGDQGGTWQIQGRVKPDAGKFVVRAAHDGEYWFCIRTVDAAGTTRPEAPPQPELRVIIDTVPPRLELTAEQGASGEVTARWRAVDPHLQPDSLKLEYQAGTNDPWEPLAIDPPTAGAKERRTLTGSTTWWPKSSTGAIMVRAKVDDRAGNPAVSQARAASTAPAPPPPSSAATRGVDPDRAAADASGRTAPPVSGPSASQGTQWPADRLSPVPLSRYQPPDPSANPTDPASNLASTPDADRWSAVGRTPAQNVSNQSNRGAGGDLINLDLLPPGERPRMVNSRSFELEYEVDSVGPSGIAKVELWGTRDGGKSWSSFGIDNDNRSPVLVSVEGEGIYGFRIVFQSGTGFGGLAPREGDAAEVWVAVDLTEPVAKITGADMGRDAGELVIRWEASDKMADAHPISLAFSAEPHGPWTPIVSDLENTGSYNWRLDNRVPERVYLRIEFRDEAGNIGVYETPQPIPLDRQRPQGHIRGVRPINRSAQGAKRNDLRSADKLPQINTDKRR